MKKILILLIFCSLVWGASCQALTAGRAAAPQKSKVAQKKAKPAPKKKAAVKKQAVPGFFGKPQAAPSYVTDPTYLPILTFAANQDVRVEVWEADAAGKKKINREPLAAADLKKGVKLNVAWTTSNLQNGDYNFLVIMTDRKGRKAEYRVPFKIYFTENQQQGQNQPRY